MQAARQDGEVQAWLEPRIAPAQNCGLNDRQIREVANVSPHGFWLLIGSVELPSPHHLPWPALDIDLAVESIRHPEKFPLVSRPDT